jgi:hypothetical protein
MELGVDMRIAVIRHDTRLGTIRLHNGDAMEWSHV